MYNTRGKGHVYWTRVICEYQVSCLFIYFYSFVIVIVELHWNLKTILSILPLLPSNKDTPSKRSKCGAHFGSPLPNHPLGSQRTGERVRTTSTCILVLHGGVSGRSVLAQYVSCCVKYIFLTTNIYRVHIKSSNWSCLCTNLNIFLTCLDNYTCNAQSN